MEGGPCTHVGDSGSSWLERCSTPAIATTWGVNQNIGRRPSLLSLSLCIFDFQVNKYSSKEKISKLRKKWVRSVVSWQRKTAPWWFPKGPSDWGVGLIALAFCRGVCLWPWVHLFLHTEEADKILLQLFTWLTFYDPCDAPSPDQGSVDCSGSALQ